MVGEEVNPLAFWPTGIVSIGRAEERAVASVLGFDQGNVGIGLDLGASFRENTNERIIHGMNDQRRHGDLIDDAGGSGAMVVIVRPGESAVASRNFMVPFSDVPRPALRHLDTVRKHPAFAAVTS